MYIKSTKSDIPGLRPRKEPGQSREDFSLFTEDKDPIAAKPSLRDLTSDVEDAQVLRKTSPPLDADSLSPVTNSSAEINFGADQKRESEREFLNKPDVVRGGGLSIKRTKRDPALDVAAPVSEEPSDVAAKIESPETLSEENSPKEPEKESEEVKVKEEALSGEPAKRRAPPEPMLAKRWGKKREAAEPVGESESAVDKPSKDRSFLYRLACATGAVAVILGAYWAGTGYMRVLGIGLPDALNIEAKVTPPKLVKAISGNDTASVSLDLDKLTQRAGELWLPGTSVEFKADTLMQQFDLTLDAANPSPFTTEESISSSVPPDGCDATLIESAHVQITCNSSSVPVLGSAALRSTGANVAE